MFRLHWKELAKSILFGFALVVISTFLSLDDPVDNPHFGEDDASRFVGLVYTYTLKPINSMIWLILEQSHVIEYSEKLIEYATGQEIMGYAQGLNSLIYHILAWSFIGFLGNMTFVFGRYHLIGQISLSFWKFSTIALAALLVFTWVGSTWISYREPNAHSPIMRDEAM